VLPRVFLLLKKVRIKIVKKFKKRGMGERKEEERYI